MNMLLLKASDNVPFIIAILLILRLVGVFVCGWKAMEKNRETFAWGLFGLLLPEVAIFWISYIKAKPGKPRRPFGSLGYGNGPGYHGGYDGGHNNPGGGPRSKEGYKGDLYKK